MNELREQFFGLINELGLTSIDRWWEPRKFRNHAYKTYYIRFLYNEKEYITYMDNYQPTYGFANGDGTITYHFGHNFEHLRSAIKRKCHIQ